MLFSGIIKKKFDAVLGRYDGDPAQYYFKPEDFPELKNESYDISGDRNVTLKGFFYYYGELKPANLIIFDHGIGAGHHAYLREIDYLARSGFTVFSYDHTGCVSTGGPGIQGFAQGINDLDHIIRGLKQDPRFHDMKFKLIGHSWGGYSAMNVAALHPEVTHVVSLAGFLSAKALVEQYIPKMFLKYSGEVMERERQINPKYTDMDARDSMMKSKAALLHLQSRDDTMVKFELCYVPLSEALKDRADTTLVALDNKDHDPHHTEGAVALYNKMKEDEKKMKPSSKQEQENFKKDHDWNAITEQDPLIWEQIINFLNTEKTK